MDKWRAQELWANWKSITSRCINVSYCCNESIEGMWCWLCCKSCCSMLGLCFWGIFSVCVFVHSALQSFKCVCVERGHTHTVCIHKAHFPSSPHSAQLFCLHCTLVLFCRKSYLPSIIRTVLALLVWTDSLHQGMDQSAQWHKLCLDSTVLWTYVKSANTGTLPSPRY